MTPPRIQTESASSAEPTRWATMEGLRKIPEPIMPPTTSMVAEEGHCVAGEAPPGALWSGRGFRGCIVSVMGILHITAIASDPQKNLDFYAGMLGLRLIKLTVNFAAPPTYPLSSGDEPGTPVRFSPFSP